MPKKSFEKLNEVSAAMGLGEPTGVELPENVGWRANPESKKKQYGENSLDSDWYPGDQILAAIGQSENRFTPLQLCVYASTLANKGTRYKATFLNRVVSSDYTSLEYVNTPVVVSQFEISNDAYYAYTKGMRDVALTGTARTILKNYPIPVAAKTGTAETDNGSDNGAFVCYAPFDDPEIAIVV